MSSENVMVVSTIGVAYCFTEDLLSPILNYLLFPTVCSIRKAERIAYIEGKGSRPVPGAQ